MKVVVSRAELVQMIGKIQSVVSSKPAIPILANILIEASSGQLVLSATDLTVSIKTFLEAQIAEEGAITLPARRFFQLIREITTPEVEIHSTTGEIATISAGSSSFRLNGMHKSEFPSLPDLSASAHLSIASETLKEMLTKTVFAAAREDSRHVLNGILMQIEKGTATCIGTDGKRLAKITTQVEISEEHQGSYLIPLKAVEEIIKTIENEQQVTMNLLHDKIAIESGNVILMTKLLSGEYPDVDRVIPETTSVTFQLHREELITLLKQVALFTTERSHSVHFIFKASELHLLAMSSEIGEGKVSMPVDYSGEPIEIAFNPFFFLDILKHCRDETVNFGITDSYNPGKITDSSSALFVIMPMRLNPI